MAPRATRGAWRRGDTRHGSTPSRWRRCHSLATGAYSSPAARSACSRDCSPSGLIEVLATELSLAAIPAARRAGLPRNVDLLHAAVPEDWPDDRFDLIVFSELGYYFDEADLDSFIGHAVAALEPHGHLVAVHWRRPVRDYPGTAANVHSRLVSSSLDHLAHYEDEHFLLDLFGAGPASALVPPDSRGTGGR